MARKRYTAEEIICHLRTVEIEGGKGLGIADACRKLGITEQTYYRWKKEYGGLCVGGKSVDYYNTLAVAFGLQFRT